MPKLKPLMTLVILLLGVALIGIPATAHPQAANSSPQNPFARVAWLVGEWRTVELASGGAPVTMELQGKWTSDMNSIIVSCNRISEDKVSTPVYQSTYTLDPNKKKVVVSQVFANGDHFEGEVSESSNDISQIGKMTRANGSAQDFRNRYVIWSPNTFSIETSQPGQPLNTVGAGLDLVYLRQTPST